MPVRLTGGIMRRIAAVLVGVAIALIPLSATASPASTHVHPHLAGGNYVIQETNGNYWLSSATNDAGNPISEETFSRNLTFTVVTTYKGRNAGYLQNSAGNFYAMTNNCDNGTIKSSATSPNTVWAPKGTSTPGAWDFVNRGCDQGAGSKDSVVIGGRNNGTIFLVCDMAIPHSCDGLFLKLTPS